MADLLTSGDRAEFFAAIKDVTDTFCKLPFVYELHGESLDVLNMDRGDEVFTDFNLNGLVVYAPSGPSDADINMKQYGATDFTGGYILVNMEDLDAAGLLSPEYLPIMDPAADWLRVSGKRYRVTGVAAKGQMGDKNAVCKINFIKDVQIR